MSHRMSIGSGGDVSAVWMRLRSEMRTRWRSWLGLALLVGLTGATAVAAAAGARRTETAYPRFVQAQNGYDLVTGGFPGNIDPERALAQIEAMPEVAQWARVDPVAHTAILPSGRLAPAPELMATTDLTGRAGFKLNRFKVISGRMVNLHAPDEAVTDFPTADREGLRVGSTVKFIVGSPDAKPVRLAAVHIVGIVASPGQFPAVGGWRGKLTWIRPICPHSGRSAFPALSYFRSGSFGPGSLGRHRLPWSSHRPSCSRHSPQSAWRGSQSPTPDSPWTACL